MLTINKSQFFFTVKSTGIYGTEKTLTGFFFFPPLVIGLVSRQKKGLNEAEPGSL